MKQSMAMGAMMLGADPTAVMDALGFSCLKAQVAGSRIEADGISTYAFLWAPPPRTGLVRAAVPTVRANVKPPAFVGAEAGVYAGAYLDVPALWVAIKDAIQKASPQMYQQMMQGIENPQAPFHVERDLINTLGTHWFLYIPRDLLGTGPGIEVKTLLAVEVRDSRRLQTTIETLLQMMGPESGVVSEQVMGKPLWKMPPLPFGAGEDGAEPVRICLALDGERLLIGTNVELVRQAVRDGARAESPLLGQAEFRAALPHMLARPEGLLYVDLRRIAEWVWNAVDATGARAPRLETVRKYLGVVTTTWKWTEDGVETKAWLPHPQP